MEREISYALSRISDADFARETQFWGNLGLKLYQLRWMIFAGNVFFGISGHHMNLDTMLLLYILPMGGLFLFTEWLRQRVEMQVLNYLMIPLDLLLITSAVMISGALMSDSYLLYIVEVIFICLYIGGKAGFIVAVLSMLFYGGAVYGDLQTNEEWLKYSYRASMILMFAVGVAFLGQQLRRQVVLNRKMAEENRRLAYTDLLTGLGNSRLFYERLDGLLGDLNDDRTSFSMVMFDCDNLKKINDCYGHDAGDLLIEQVAACGREVFEPAGAVFRYAGDEFYVLIADLDSAIVEQRAELFIERLASRRISYHGSEFATTVSVGVVHFMRGLDTDVTRVEAIRLADQALYESKNKGKACLTTYLVCA